MKQRDANDIAREEGIESLRGTLDEAHPFEKGKRASGNGHDGATTPSLLTLPEFLAQFVPPHYLVDGVLQHHCLYSLTGKTGAGKTNVAVLLAALVADPVAGQKFGSHDVEPGRVLYIPAENKTDVQMRAIGLVHRMYLDPARLNLLV